MISHRTCHFPLRAATTCLVMLAATCVLAGQRDMARFGPVGLKGWEGTVAAGPAAALGALATTRKQLADSGVTFAFEDISEVLANVSGGSRRTSTFEGATFISATLDLATLFGLAGGTIKASGYQIHGNGISSDADVINIISGIEAAPSARLFELWYDQSFGAGTTIRIGQQAADQEFLIDEYAGVFVNAAFGWPTLPATDLPSGGNAYPLATPGIRLKISPIKDVTLLAAIYNGDPSDNGSGTSFVLDKGIFGIVEAQFAIYHNDGPDHASPGLPGTYKMGFWYNSNEFADQRIGNDGLPLADPDGSGVPLMHRNDWGFYGLADQMLYRETPTGDQGLAGFVRLMASPADRNEISFFGNVGLTYKGLLPTRPDDVIGLGLAYAALGSAAQGFQADSIRFSGMPRSIRSHEAVVELTYQAALTDWWSIQPDLQYAFAPSGSALDFDEPQPSDALIVGIRSSITF